MVCGSPCLWHCWQATCCHRWGLFPASWMTSPLPRSVGFAFPPAADCCLLVFLLAGHRAHVHMVHATLALPPSARARPTHAEGCGVAVVVALHCLHRCRSCGSAGGWLRHRLQAHVPPPGAAVLAFDGGGVLVCTHRPSYAACVLVLRRVRLFRVVLQLFDALQPCVAVCVCGCGCGCAGREQDFWCCVAGIGATCSSGFVLRRLSSLCSR